MILWSIILCKLKIWISYSTLEKQLPIYNLFMKSSFKILKSNTFFLRKKCFIPMKTKTYLKKMNKENSLMKIYEKWWNWSNKILENKYFLTYIQNDIIHNQIYKKNIHFMLNKFRPIKFLIKICFPFPQVKWGFIHTKMTTSIQAMLAKVNSEKLIGGSLKEVH